MALLDFLKNKDEKEKAKKAAPKKVQPGLVAKEAPKKAEAAPTQVKTSGKSAKAFSYTAIKEPHISEKSSNLSADNKYTFKVSSNTNKLEIKKSVEGLYNVSVLNVNIIKSPVKKRRLGRTEGYKKAFTKAVVTIKEGQKIELF